MKKRNKKGNVLYKIIGVLLLISSLFLVGISIKTDFISALPLKYLLAGGGIILFVNLFLGFFLFRKRVKQKPKKVASFFAIIFTIFFGLASFYIYKTFGVLDNMTKDTRIYTYHVMVLNDAKYESINDLTGETLGYYNNNSNSIKKAREVLKKKVTAKEEPFGNLEGLGSSLLDKSTDAILVEKSQKDILDKATDVETKEITSSLNTYGGESTDDSETSSISNNKISLSGFSSKTRVLYTFKVEAKVDSKEVDVTKDVFNVYISGMDEYGKVREVSRSDVNIIATINPKTRQILLTNVPRDYYVQLHDTIGYKDKLTHAGTYGIDTSVKTLEDLLGIEINYYYKVNFSSLKNIVNALGGVEVYSEYDFRSWNGYNFSKGLNKVNGRQALAFARERKTFQDGDNQRGKNQQALIEAIFKKCTSPSIITNYSSLLNSLMDSILTNMGTKSITSLAKMQLKDNSKWTITSQQLSGTGGSNYTYTAPGQLLYVTIPDEESITKAKDNIKKVSDGEKLDSSYKYDSSDVHGVTKSYVPKRTISYTTSSSSTKKTTTKKVKTKKSKTANKVSSTNSSKVSSKASKSSSTSRASSSKASSSKPSSTSSSSSSNSSTGSTSGSAGSSSGSSSGSSNSSSSTSTGGESGGDVGNTQSANE